jgi:tRNA1Val (adenine37-N6)-methyltransferase
LAQPRDGYRFSIDSILVAWWVDFRAEDKVVELGCGVGVVALTLACCRGARNVTGVELQGDLAALARANVAANGAASRVAITEGDARALGAEFGGAFDVACANPPFREAGAGRLNPGPGKAAGRHELTLTLEGLARAAAFALRDGGRFFLVHQPRRLPALMAALGAAGLHVERLRFVQPREGEPAKLVLAAARRRGARETVVLPPLVIYGAGGDYAAEVAAICRGEGRPLYEVVR